MIIIGTNDEDMLLAQKELVKSQGGKVVVRNGEILAKLPLPVAGLMSYEDIEFVTEKSEALNKAAKEIGCVVDDPFMSLPVIPQLKITDKGIFSTDIFNFIDIFETEPAKV